ncbi:acyltransferase family protein [Methylobacterium crusticola]|uniref:acyltransferase family protein n=1 Tax=Methylobacterium crusticola TaxID=1697972 RepID=UPI001EE2B596|nr:acyltransferase [Methylobacterium crusticola]
MRRPPTLPLIQVLRALAALMVVVSHAQFDAAGYAARAGLAFAPAAFLPWNAGVDVFFVISGFIIVHAAGPLHGRPGARRVFLAHRVARVVPLYWLATTAYLVLAWLRPGLINAAGEGLAPGFVAASYLFWPAARPDGFVQPLYSLGWTLNYEMAFYALFALVLPLARRRAVAALLGLLAGLVLVHALAEGLPTPLAFWTHPIVLEFGGGAALGLARSEGVRLPAAACLVLAGLGLALLSGAGEAGGLPRVLAWGGPAILLVAAAALGQDPAAPPGGPGPLLRLAVVVGNASYALYLVHPFTVRGVRVAVEAAGLAPGVPVLVGLMLALSCAGALGVHRLVERPLTRAVRAALDPPAPGAARAPAARSGN